MRLIGVEKYLATENQPALKSGVLRFQYEPRQFLPSFQPFSSSSSLPFPLPPSFYLFLYSPLYGILTAWFGRKGDTVTVQRPRPSRWDLPGHGERATMVMEL